MSRLMSFSTVLSSNCLLIPRIFMNVSASSPIALPFVTFTYMILSYIKLKFFPSSLNAFSSFKSFSIFCFVFALIVYKL
nr:hypothetical protein GZ17A3_27 [uncultured archaeon GZfos17A3]